MIENTVLQISLPASAVSFASLFVGGTHCVQSVVAMSRTGIDCHSFSSGKTPEAIRCALNPQFLLYPGKKLFVETLSAFSIEVGADRPGFPQLFYLRPRNVCTANDPAGAAALIFPCIDFSQDNMQMFILKTQVCILNMVRAAGLEPARVKHRFLRPACLPFQHARIYNLYFII